MTDQDLIRHYGGPSQLARLMNWTKPGSVPRVRNWLTRGIPPAVKLEYPHLFLNKRLKLKPAQADVPGRAAALVEA